MFQGTALRAVFAFAVLGLTSLAQATDLPMVKVKSSYPVGYNGAINASIDDGGRGLTLFTFKDSRGESMSFTVDEIRKGVVLAEVKGKKVLKISGPNFTAEAGGEVILTFLKGFFGNDKRELRVEYLRKGGPTDWVLQTNDADGRDAFDGISVYINKHLGIPTSVGSIALFGGDKQIRKYNPNELPPGTLPIE
jgi:hypothetical protein